jgi:hypothetical protein
VTPDVNVLLAAAMQSQDEHLVTFDGGFERLLPRSHCTRLAVAGS